MSAGMSGANVVDKAKMVFHYVAKISVPRPSNSSEGLDITQCKEMKVCFRHSKHSIKCDPNAPCPECDTGMKLYSYEQSRRHLDVVRSEKRFESIEVDRSENIIEKLIDIDENGKRMNHLLEMILTKQGLIANALTDLASSFKDLNAKSDANKTKTRHEFDEDEEKLLPTLKEISRNTLRSHKKQEEICTQINECHNALVVLKANSDSINTSNNLVNHNLSSMNTNLTLICGKMDESVSHLNDSSATQQSNATLEKIHSSNEKLLLEIYQIKTVVNECKASIKDELNILKSDIINELQSGRNERINSSNAWKDEMNMSLNSVKQEMSSFKNMIHSFADEIKDTLPEKLMDVFSSILLLSGENGRKMDTNEECEISKTDF